MFFTWCKYTTWIILLTLAFGLNRFVLDFKSGKDVAFHFNPRFSENHKKVIVCNSHLNNIWGQEERQMIFPFESGKPFKVSYCYSYVLIMHIPHGDITLKSRCTWNEFWGAILGHLTSSSPSQAPMIIGRLEQWHTPQLYTVTTSEFKLFWKWEK